MDAYSQYSISEISTFLKIWGTGFKGLNPQQYPQAEAYYQACVDAHENINNRKMHFYSLAGLRRTLLLIGSDFYAEYAMKKQGEYKQRSELCEYIANHLLRSKEEVIQTELF